MGKRKFPSFQGIQVSVKNKMEGKYNLSIFDMEKGKILESFVTGKSGKIVISLPEFEKWIAFKSFSREGSVWLEITDSGIGIEPDEIETIFEFGKSHKGSSGFGLYYCKMFVEANNGTLTINSPGRGKGAMVSVTLPAANSVPRQMSKAKKLGHEGARLCV